MIARNGLFLALLLAAAAYFTGGGWGLPSPARRDRVYVPEQRQGAFYAKVEENRRDHYKKVGENLQAAFGRGWTGTLLPPSTGFTLLKHPAGEPKGVLLHGYSAFALRSVEQDEQFALNAVSRFRPKKLQFDPKQSLYGGSYIYPLAAWWAALHAVRVVRLVPDALHYYFYPEDLAKLYRAGRALSALSGLGCMLMLFLLGRRMYDERTGAWAAALFGLAPAVVSYAHVLKPHLTAAFYALACLWLASRKSWRLSAALFGLAVGAAKNLAPLAAPLAIGFLLAEKRAYKKLAGLAALSVAVFFAVNPYVLINFSDFLAEMRGMARWYSSGADPLAPLRALGTPVREGMGLAWAVMIGGCLAMTQTKRPQDRLLAAWAGSLLALTAWQMGTGATDPGAARFFLPVMALGCLIGAAGAQGMLGTILLCGVLIVNAMRGVDRLQRFAADNQRSSNAEFAADWIESNVPVKSEIGMSTPAPMVDRFPPIPFSRYTLVYVSGRPSEKDAAKLPKRYVNDHLPAELADFYKVEKQFGEPWDRDAFTQANPRIAVYVRR